ncbi:MAG: VCBS repeat-containing protein, partial [Polyangia bacterium]|nr:VCBS repeat-containing protein [Polyangia bacterium]
PQDLWWFTRTGTIISGSATTFQQRLVDSALTHAIFGTAADFNNDDRIDLIALEIIKPAYISEAYYYSYENTGLLHTATCAVTEDPTNPGGCAFIRRLGANLNSLSTGQWVVGTARDSVDVDGDGFRDLTFYTMSSGGNVAIPVYILTGNGDGTFDVPSTPLFSHNSGGCGASPANTILFGDFDGDSLGDVIIGLDDDGDPGSAWFYKGLLLGGNFSFDFAHCFEAFDINPEETGSDRPGATGAVRAFDFDFDGNLDVMVGWRNQSATAPPTETILLLGNGDGTFAAPILVRSFPTTDYGTTFATPQRLCARFPISAP